MTLEKQGIPSVAVITAPFAFKARAEVRALGVEALATLILPHPIGQISDDEMRSLTDESFGEIEFALTRDAGLVANAYRGAVEPRSRFSR